MQTSTDASSSLVSDIITSFASLPKWVLIWLFCVLGPINVAAFFFLNEPNGMAVAALVGVGMLLSLLPIPFERGLSKATAFGHVIPWTILVVYIVFFKPAADGLYGVYLSALVIVNTVSLVFDYMDSFKWIKGDRAVAGAPEP